MGQMMRRSPTEKREIIHLVEHSALLVERTLDELDVPRSSFHRWYRHYQRDGEKGLGPQPPGRRQFWNRLPEAVCGPDCPDGAGSPSGGLASKLSQGPNFSGTNAS